MHAGEVYLNGKSFFEAASLDEVLNPLPRTTGFNPPWTRRPELIPHPEDTIYRWFAQVDEQNTTLYANFRTHLPNDELTEINVRKCCFYPQRSGLDYITVRGFEMAQAACPWTPPTADQPGLLGPHWSRGWTIENNVIHDAKCSGISIGKDSATGDGLSARLHRKSGYQHQMEAMFLALQSGWKRETIGSHTIRDNIIYDCGQNGIVGHMGGAFSQIIGNHIYNIGTKHEFFGHEIAGIKLHAAIDVQIEKNNIHDCTLGVWLDWQAQGARISRNLFYRNGRDLMVEVTHGPYLVDSNILGSQYSLENMAQGGAYVHNLFCGTTRRDSVLNRSTPYHFPHSTGVAGSALVYSGDDRLFNNIFVGGIKTYTEKSSCGTHSYDGSTRSLHEYGHLARALGASDDSNFDKVRQPAFIEGNAYLNGAPAWQHEEHHFLGTDESVIEIHEEEDGVYLTLDVQKEMLDLFTEIVSTQTLGMPRITQAPFDDPQGKPIRLDYDYLGAQRGEQPVPGPLEKLQEGSNYIKVWADIRLNQLSE